MQGQDTHLPIEGNIIPGSLVPGAKLKGCSQVCTLMCTHASMFLNLHQMTSVYKPTPHPFTLGKVLSCIPLLQDSGRNMT